VNRRQVLQGMGAATALAGPGAALASANEHGAGPWWLLSPLQPGDGVGFDWRLDRLETWDRGAWVLTLKRGSERARVHICYHDGAPRGVAHGELLDLILMDGGHGEKPTTESLGRVLRQLATQLRKNELLEGAEAELGALMTHAERVDRYGPESLI